MSPERTEIRALDPETVDKIAAGEVVERPASVVKELVENSLDAGATGITVAVGSGGRDRIRVADDGVGMNEGSVRKAVEQHTTSKLRDVADLERGVSTLGFRGEALYTIGAVSRLAITTKPRGSETGTKLVLAGGEVESVEPAGCPEGTAVEVTDLFYNTPARKKYLKREATEFDHVNTVVTRYALANPGVRFALEHDGREVFSTTGQGDLQATVLSVYGREVARAMVPIEGLAAGPLEGLSGYVSDPETTRSSPAYVSTYVNGRYVRSKPIRSAVVGAYGTQLAPDRYPFAVLDLDVSPGTVDVNVHPRKMEVRFGDGEAIEAQIEKTVRETLLDHGLIRSSAPRGRSTPEETEIAPSADGTDGTDGAAGSNDTPEPGSGAGGDRPTGASRQAGEALKRSNDAADGANDTPRSAASSPPVEREESTEKRFSSLTRQATFGEPDEPNYERLPDLRVLGQIQDTYVLCAAPKGLLVVDQHAADERVHYERLRAELAGETTTQTLVEPVELELTAREAELFDAHEGALARVGFAATREGRTVRIGAVPAAFDATLSPELLRDALSACLSGDPGETVEATVDELLGDLACYPAVTGNTSLREGSVVDLLGALDGCENPYACPHGRPTVIRIDREELAERFERDYPGHAGRREP
ncbi:DNA mismatch repair endonuclease MutL [Halalkalicoccus jeotgali]|uniref:DNA mismatch repair protein MutL n=1 Tax=Halalkalicoccus jeotgali (strain DSM 18796 / CECT 7217 / JCM 14584 / KCTC 4019 / B3) TaxID=795797 RepID=D8J8L2_HALJB|nr:DNA mismatch repair endonuclease MutL [Halalkalicoccus jeotgali]ADJ16258.1 DNA mismatch repair protein MutL [Halalkalicoccus jeotgali B3]ELY36993.1 DNA mismatch repair protein MutL [Halalkalicoccus jeotgali B3]